MDSAARRKRLLKATRKAEHSARQIQHPVVVAGSEDPGEVVFSKSLNALADAFARRQVGRCSSVFRVLRERGIINDEVAKNVFKFLQTACLCVCDGERELWEWLVQCCHDLSHYSYLEPWQTYALMLMTVGVRFVTPTDDKLLQLRKLNSQMSLSSTAACSPARLGCDDSELTGHLHGGLALQAFLDVCNGAASLAQVRLSDAFGLARGALFMFLTDSRGYERFLEVALSLLEASLEFCDPTIFREDMNNVPPLSELMRGLASAAVLHESASIIYDKVNFLRFRCEKIALQILKMLSFRMSIVLFRSLLLQYEHLSDLSLLLVRSIGTLQNKWPSSDDGSNSIAFEELKGYVEDVFNSGEIFMPSSDYAPGFYVRGFNGQLKTVEAAVSLYNFVLWKESRDNVNYTGLSSEEERERARKCWLDPLLDQASTASIQDCFLRRDADTTRKMVNWAYKTNLEPEWAKTVGRPLL